MLAEYKAYETEDFINHVERIYVDRKDKKVKEITF
jgi:hypothetical protein